MHFVLLMIKLVLIRSNVKVINMRNSLVKMAKSCLWLLSIFNGDFTVIKVGRPTPVPAIVFSSLVFYVS